MMISSTMIYEIICLLILSNITLTYSTKQYYKLDAKSRYNNVYKTQQYQQQSQQYQQQPRNQPKYQQQQPSYYRQYKQMKVDLKQYDDTSETYYGDNNYNYIYSYSYSSQIGSQYYSHSSSYLYSIIYIENANDDDSLDYDSNSDENQYGIIKFFIAGFAAITGIYFYRSYHKDKKEILDKGYEMVDINDGDDSNIDDEINEAADSQKNVDIKDLKYIPIKANDE